MPKKHDEKRIEALRERLYARDVPQQQYERKPLAGEPDPVPTDWDRPEPQSQKPTTPVYDNEPPEPETPKFTLMGHLKNRRSLRTKLLLAALGFFVLSITLSSLFILLGGNSISGDNITITANGPFTIGGGEDFPLQVGITNQNNVAIQSATLIVEYPSGTQSVEDEGKPLFIERTPIESIRAGETINVPMKARVFGEENQELEIRTSIEYRVAGSNATFFKEADPLRFKISSSPVSLEVETVEAVASGQETDITLVVKSNSSAALSNILVKAEYPSGFDFTESTPSPVSGQNTWLIRDLEPEEEVEVTITGILIGKESDERVMYFSVGVPNERDQYNLASVFSTASAEFSIEQPFLDVSLTVDNRESDFSVEPGRSSNVSIRVANSLDDTVYNAVVKAVLSGNALSDVDVQVSDGFYDSNTRTITWDRTSSSRFSELAPGVAEGLRFVVTPNTDALRTPQINLEVSVHAERVRESRVSGTLVGSARATIKVASIVRLLSETGYNTPAFSGAGPVPPVVGERTTYTITLRAEGGSNDVADTVVTGTIPSYVTWQNNTAGSGAIAFNASTRTFEWDAGDIDANESKTAAFQVEILPSVSQIGTTPTLTGEQHLRAEDRFTGTVIRATSPALTTRLSSEAGFGDNSGAVQASN